MYYGCRQIRPLNDEPKLSGEGIVIGTLVVEVRVPEDGSSHETGGMA